LGITHTAEKVKAAPPYSRGTPTAVSGWEYGVWRGLEALQSLASLEGKTVLDVGCGFGAYGLAAERYARPPLITLLSTKEVVTADTRRIFTVFGKSLDIAILPVLITFTLIVAFKIIEVLA